jgi:hypothetical protein
MKFVEYREQVKALIYGKQLPTAVYLHRSAIESALSNTLFSFILDNVNKLGITEPWNLLKLYKRDFKITILNYPDFDTYAYPAIHTSITNRLRRAKKRKANNQKSE